MIELSSRVLAEQSKDYEIAAWLCEALLRQHSFAGLRDGFVLARRLAEGFWDALYPGPKAEDRVSQFGGLFLGALVLPVRQVSITEGTEYSELDYDEAKRKAGPLLQQIEQAARQTSTEFYVRLTGDLKGAIAELEQLAKVLREKCGKDEGGVELAPSPRDVVKAMQGVSDAVTGLGRRPAQGSDAAAGGRCGKRQPQPPQPRQPPTATSRRR